MRHMHMTGVACVLFLAALAVPCPAADVYGEAEREAREKYQYEVETARQRYGEESEDYREAVARAADEYRERVAAAAVRTHAYAQEQAAASPSPADPEDGRAGEEQSDWDAFKEKSKDVGRTVEHGSEKAGDAIKRGAKRVKKFLKDGYNDIVN